MIALTYSELKALHPCSDSLKRVARQLGGARKWRNRRVTAAEARAAGATRDDILWAASAVAQDNTDVERRLRLWLADCAARVLHIYERSGASAAPRNAIIAARAYARGEISAAAMDTAMDAAGAVAEAAGWAVAKAAADADAAAWAVAEAAARDAAWAAAWAAAWNVADDAARAAARAVGEATAWAAAWAAAWNVADDAARAAAWNVAEATARDAARDAAWNVADDAARAAARAIGEATARDAARAVAEAAEATARAAEEAWQFDRLIARLSDPEPADWPLPGRVGA